MASYICTNCGCLETSLLRQGRRKRECARCGCAFLPKPLRHCVTCGATLRPLTSNCDNCHDNPDPGDIEVETGYEL